MDDNFEKLFSILGAELVAPEEFVLKVDDPRPDLDLTMVDVKDGEPHVIVIAKRPEVDVEIPSVAARVPDGGGCDVEISTRTPWGPLDGIPITSPPQPTITLDTDTDNIDVPKVDKTDTAAPDYRPEVVEVSSTHLISTWLQGQTIPLDTDNLTPDLEPIPIPSTGIEIETSEPKIDLDFKMDDLEEPDNPERKALGLKGMKIDFEPIVTPDVPVDTEEPKLEAPDVHIHTTIPHSHVDFSIGVVKTDVEMPQQPTTSKVVKRKSHLKIVPPDPVHLHLEQPQLEIPELSINISEPEIPQSDLEISVGTLVAEEPTTSKVVKKKSHLKIVPPAPVHLHLEQLELECPAISINISEPEVGQSDIDFSIGTLVNVEEPTAKVTKKRQLKIVQPDPVHLHLEQPKLDLPEIGLQFEELQVGDLDFNVGTLGAEIKIPRIAVKTKPKPVLIETPPAHVHTHGHHDLDVPAVGISIDIPTIPQDDMKFTADELETEIPVLDVPAKTKTRTRVDISKVQGNLQVDLEEPELEVPQVAISVAELAVPDLDFNIGELDVNVKMPAIRAKTKNKIATTSGNVHVHLDEPQLEIPKIGIDVTDPPKFDDLDFSVDKVDVDHLKFTDVETRVAIDAIQTEDKVKIELEQPEVEAPKIDVNIEEPTAPDTDLGFSVDKLDVDTTVRDAKTRVKIGLIGLGDKLNIDLEDPEFEAPQIGVGVSDLEISDTDVDFSVGKLDVDMTVRDAKTRVKVGLSGLGDKVKIDLAHPEFEAPDIGVSVGELEVPDVDLDFSVGELDVDVKIPQFKTRTKQTIKVVPTLAHTHGVHVHLDEPKFDTTDIKIDKFDTEELTVPDSDLEFPAVTLELDTPEVAIRRKHKTVITTPHLHLVDELHLDIPDISLGLPDAPTGDLDFNVGDLDTNVEIPGVAIKKVRVIQRHRHSHDLGSDEAAPDIEQEIEIPESIEVPKIDLRLTGKLLELNSNYVIVKLFRRLHEQYLSKLNESFY